MLPNQKRIDLKKQAKLLRNTGEDFIYTSTKKLVPKKTIGPRCNVNNCKTNHRECFLFTDCDREQIREDYYNMGNIQSQREYVVRHIKIKTPRQKTVRGPSWRKKTHFFYLTLKDKQI